jgi:TatD DNase family protein
MVFIDTHCHIDFMQDIPEIIKRANDKKVGIIVNNGINIESNRKTLELAKRYGVKAALGIYPIDALKLSEKEINEEINFIKKNNEKVIAIGEVGIDLKWSNDLEKQQINFQKFIDLAKELDKPLIVHARNAEKETIDILEKNKCKKVIMHCFGGDMKLVERIIKNKWLMSIPANVVFSEHFQKIVETAPIENLLCETDSPYLHPIKGQKDNEPSNVIESYKKIAEIKKITLKEAQEKIYKNFEETFLGI